MKQGAFSTEVSEQVVRAAWLHYVGGYPHGQVAKLLGVSRREVHENLVEAREAGIVAISARHHFAHTAEVAESLRRKYGLGFCRVTPPLAADPDRGETGPPSAPDLADQSAGARRGVGIVAAEYLNNELRCNERCVVGIDWGRTVSQVPQHLGGLPRPGVKFVSILGSLRRSLALNPLEATSLFARATGGESYFLPVPFIADSIEDRRVLAAQTTFRETVALAEKAALFLVSLGRCDLDGPLFRQEHLSEPDLRGLQRAGAVCCFLGKFLDARGRVVDHEVNERSLAVDLTNPRDRKMVVLSAGREKLAGIRSVLRTGHVYGLIIDGDTALRLERD